jgi:DNA-binding NtrC family response regulator
MTSQQAWAWAAAPQARRAAAVRRGPTGKPGKGEQPPPTILVLEDEILIRFPVSDYLRDCGYRVLEASSAAEAQAILRSGEPVEIMFSDINLAGDINGFAMAQWVRREYPDVKIILTSGVRRVAEQAGDLCDEGPFLAKPYAYETLLEHIKRLLASDAS